LARRSGDPTRDFAKLHRLHSLRRARSRAALLAAVATALAAPAARAAEPTPGPAAAAADRAPSAAVPPALPPGAPPPATERTDTPAPRCPIPAPLVLSAERPSDPNRIEVSSDGAAVDEAGNAQLTGRVRVRQGDRYLEAEDARYDAGTQAFDVAGGVSFRDPQLRLRGDSGTWSAATGGSFGGAEFELPARPARGSAERITLSPEGVLDLGDVEYTSCPVGNRDWYLRADSIVIDQQEQLGTGRNVRLQFKGVPILYTPVISFPVGDARKSGWLFPAFGQSSRHGFELAVPWYWNLAPNYDATLTPGVLSRRGLTLGSQFRYLTSRSRGQFDADWVPSDDDADGDARHYVRFVDRTDFTSRLRLDTALANASDSLYFEDFALGPEGTSTLFLERAARLTYLDEHWRATGLVQQFQTIDRFLAREDRPYARAPQVLVRGRWGGARGPGLEMRGEGVYFTRDEGVTGSRFDLEPTASWAWRRPGAFVVPALGLRATTWSLSEERVGDRSPTRTAPVATVDAGLVLERTAGRRVQTLEPRVLYAYVPYREQSDLPLFDTGLPTLNLVQLFRPQRYVGADRLGDANQVAVGATTRLVDAATGREVLAATLGQIYYIDPPRVQLPGETAPTANSSDIIAQLALNTFDKWTVRLGHQWNPHENQSVRSDFRAQYTPGAGRTLSAGYRFQRGVVEQVDGAFTWPVGEAWSLYGAHTYSLRDEQPIASFLGVEYRACCWKVRVLGRRYVSSRTGSQDTGVSVQLELNGLSNVSESPSAFLERAVRGYSTPGGGPVQ
jgi:LPS-assembly protein